MIPATRETGLLGVRIGPSSLGALCERIVNQPRGASPVVVACANPHSLVVANQDSEFRQGLGRCSALIADGVGLVVAARMLGSDVGPRITGSDLHDEVMATLQRRGGGRVFYFGSSEFVLQRIRERAARDYPDVEVASLSPPYGEWSETENDSMIERIRAADPDVLWVGMTAPKQEKWVAVYGARTGVPAIGCIGAVFDFYAGTVRRAPGWVCRIGLEWLYRLVGEPRRLWRRTLLSAPRFAWLLLQHEVLGSKSLRYVETHDP